MVTLTYLEFYSGIGGWGYALERALRNVASSSSSPSIEPQLLGAYDHSDLCKTVFNHNHQNKKLFRQTPIENIKREKLEALSAYVWCMSPVSEQICLLSYYDMLNNIDLKHHDVMNIYLQPCQPHTRQHSNQQCEIDDPRSKSFLHLCDMIGTMEETTLPCLILLENVVGFELSGTASSDETQTQSTDKIRRGSFQTWRENLSKRGYRNAHFHLDPTDIGIPNARPRHYTVSFRPGSLHSKIENATISSQLKSMGSLTPNNYATLFSDEILNKPPIIHGPKSLGATPPTLPCIGDFLDPDNKVESSKLRIPKKVWSSSSAWCFDVVTPSHQRSACFTYSYAKFVRGTGSILYTGPLETETHNSDEDGNKTSRKRDRAMAFLDLQAPEGRSFDADWSKDIDWENDMRYFSGTEIARLMGFPVSDPAAGKSAPTDDKSVDKSFRKFSFPSTINVKQQWKLLGNSLNVEVAGKVAEIGIISLFQ